MAMLRRGVRSRLESLRQVSRALQEVADDIWPSVEYAVDLQWLSKFWKSTRGICRRAAQRARRARRSEELPLMDSDPEPQAELQEGDHQQVVASAERDMEAGHGHSTGNPGEGLGHRSSDALVVPQQSSQPLAPEAGATGGGEAMNLEDCPVPLQPGNTQGAKALSG